MAHCKLTNFQFYRSRFSLYFLFVFLFIFTFNDQIFVCFAQIPNLFSTPETPNTIKKKKIIGGIAANSMSTTETSTQTAPKTGGENSASPPKPNNPESSQITVSNPASASIPTYDPAMDNKTIAPSSPIGLFGMPIGEVEETLKNYGAKPFSYAFGKYSRLTFSVYLLTLYFDKKRNLGEVEISPIPPFQRVEPKASDFLIKLLIQGNDLSKFKVLKNATNLDIRYLEEKN
ncbi:MAG: hypothetical protein HQM08_14660 [Candidatus Riflebacteria bacterium]|nr:hypothetical protein [Candidatus Riflebacteria bacterium]